jgi:7-dehydrocholesterol reductase
VPEVAASVAWTVPGACQGHLIPYFYAIYLTVLLTDRAFRDDVR